MASYRPTLAAAGATAADPVGAADQAVQTALSNVPASLSAANSPIGAILTPSVEGYGHSLLASYGASDYIAGQPSKFGMLERLASMLGAETIHKTAQAGGVAATAYAGGGVSYPLYCLPPTDRVAGPYVTKGGVKVCYIGFNDYPYYQAVTNGNALVEAAITLACSRLLASRVIPALGITSAVDPAFTMSTSPAWATNGDASVSNPQGYAYTTVTGGTVTLSLDAAYNGEAFSIMLPVVSGNYSTVTVAVDGTTVATRSTQNDQAALAAAGILDTIIALRVPAGTVAAGAHTVVITFSSQTGDSFFGGVIIEGSVPPPLLIPLSPTATYSFTSTFATQGPWANTRNTNVAANFPSAVLVDMSAALAPNGGASADNIYWNTSLAHPNDLGYSRMAAALYDAAKPVLLSRNAGQQNRLRIEPKVMTETARAATTGSITLSGTQTVDGVALVDGDLCLVKNQGGSTNGLWIVRAGIWQMHPSMYGPSGSVPNNHTVNVGPEGTANADTQWTAATAAAIIPLYTTITYVRTDGRWDTWKTLYTASALLAASASASGANPYVLRYDGGTPVVVTSAMNGGSAAFELDPANYAVTGKTIQVRLAAYALTNSTAPGITFTFGLYPITATAGLVPTVGAASTTVAIATPALNTRTPAWGAAITMPTAGAYLLGFTTSALNAAATQILGAALQVRAN